MALTFSTQANIAFKNLLGKSQTDSSKGINNEEEGIFLNIDSSNIWTSILSATPSSSVSVGDAIFVTASLVLDTTSNDHAYFAEWPSIPPSGTDPLTSVTYSYGLGVLSGISSGDRIRSSIPPTYGYLYEAKPYSAGPSLISPGDSKNWIYQYNSGVFYQQDNVGPTPTLIELYVYTGEKLSSQQVVPASNIRVVASGVDNYLGTASPTIATYSSTDLYLIDFDTTNTGATAVTIDIDGLGAYEIIKFDESGPISLTASSELVVGQTYYMTWDGANFQLFDYDPQSSSPVTYTNPSPVPTTIGGIVSGLTFSNATMKQMWDLLLYPYQQPNFLSFTFNFGSNPKEVGDVITAGSKNFTWNISYPANIQANTITIKDITNATTLISGTANDGLAALTIGTVSKTSQANHTWRAYAQRTNSTVIQMNKTVSWYWRRFSGTQSSTTLSAAQIQALSTQSLTNVRTGTYTFGTGSYKYFAWPTAFGAPTLFKDDSTNLAIAMAGTAEGYNTAAGIYYADVVSVTNTFGITTNYYVFRTRNILGGSIDIVVT